MLNFHSSFSSSLFKHTLSHAQYINHSKSATKIYHTTNHHRVMFLAHSLSLSLFLLSERKLDHSYFLGLRNSCDYCTTHPNKKSPLEQHLLFAVLLLVVVLVTVVVLQAFFSSPLINYFFGVFLFLFLTPFISSPIKFLYAFKLFPHFRFETNLFFDANKKSPPKFSGW